MQVLCKEMKTLLKYLAPSALLLAFCGACSAGPTVVLHPQSASVAIRDSKFEVVQELRDPKQIKIVQDAFLRAKRVGDTATKLRGATHKIDFTDRWLIDLHSGEFGVLTKVVTDVYQLDAKDLRTIKELLEPKAQSGPGD
jgi:hypothetical protein